MTRSITQFVLICGDRIYGPAPLEEIEFLFDNLSEDTKRHCDIRRLEAPKTLRELLNL